MRHALRHTVRREDHFFIQLRQRGDKEGKVNAQVFYNYDIQKKEEEMEDLNELETNIDSSLQIANAKIELLEAPNGKK